MNNFDIIYYINLDDRTDRKTSILEQLSNMNVDPLRIKRIGAVQHEIPHLGCSLSHQLCLQDFQDSSHNTCVIFEDDFIFKESNDHVSTTLNEFFHNHIEWDVLMFSAFDRQTNPSKIQHLTKAVNVQTASGYAVHKSFLPELKRNINAGIEMLTRNPNVGDYCVDQYWKRLQETSNWYLFHPKLGHQRDDYSDIERRHVSYTDRYDSPYHYPYKYILGVVSCKMNHDKALSQHETHFRSIDKTSILYVRIIGDPLLEKTYMYNELEDTLTLKCEDDYLNLPHKVYLFLQAIKQLFPNVRGVFKTDDDVDINIIKLETFLNQHYEVPYCGVYCEQKDDVCSHLSNKEHVTERYPIFKEVPVKMQYAPYCPGGGYYLSMHAVSIILNHPNNFLPFPTNYKSYMTTIHNSIIKHDKVCHVTNIYFDNLCVFEDKQIGMTLYQNNIMGIDKRDELKDILKWSGLNNIL
jgi:GR25 family glycosyltransferase involved in LPS biosynthesis